MENKFPIEPTAPIETKEPVVLHSGQLDGSLMDLPSVRPTEATPSLQEAWDEKDPITEEHVMKVPENAAAITPEKKSRKRLLVTLTASAATLLAAGGLYLGLNSGNDTPKSEPVAEAPANPGEEVPFGEEPANPVDPEVSPEEPATPETPATFEVAGLPTLAELEINPNQSDEQVAQSLVKLSSDWSMAGASKEMYDLQFAPDNEYLSLEDYVTKITDATDPIYVQAIYGENATNPQFADAIALQKEQHRQVLMAHFQTYGNQNTAPYYQKENFSQLQEAIKNGDGTTTMFVTMIREDNGADNIVEGSGNGNITRATYLTAEVDGKIKLVQPPAYVLQ